MKCPLCQFPHTNILFPFPNPRNIGPIALSYRRCDRCQLVYLFPAPTPSQLKKIYFSNQYFTRLCQPTSHPWLDKIFQIRLFPEYWDYVNFQFPKPGSVLDVGCGNGEFLHQMRKLGWQISGSDLSRTAIANTRKLLGIDVLLKSGDIAHQDFPRRFSAVTLWHVLEHVDNPRPFLKKLRQLLLPEGKIILEVPNSDSLLFSWFKKNYNWLMVPEHIFNYSPASLEYLFSSCGFKIIRFDFPPRALLNFSLSLSRLLSSRLALFASLPLSAAVGVLAAFAKRGEVVRLVATV